MSGRYRVARLEDIDSMRGPAGLTWRPVRAALGVHAFGVASFVAEAAGADVIEPHLESEGRGHEEVYIVVRGAARFTLDGEAFDAAAGTVVFAAPEVHRHAVAAEPDTEVLVFGAEPLLARYA